MQLGQRLLTELVIVRGSRCTIESERNPVEARAERDSQTGA
jgi:hypothetical protein